jgi:hypothetical protein
MLLEKVDLLTILDTATHHPLISLCMVRNGHWTILRSPWVREQNLYVSSSLGDIIQLILKPY